MHRDPQIVLELLFWQDALEPAMRVADVAIEDGDAQPVGGRRRLRHGAVAPQGHARAPRVLMEPAREREV